MTLILLIKNYLEIQNNFYQFNHKSPIAIPKVLLELYVSKNQLGKYKSCSLYMQKHSLNIFLVDNNVNFSHKVNHVIYRLQTLR